MYKSMTSTCAIDESVQNWCFCYVGCCEVIEIDKLLLGETDSLLIKIMLTEYLPKKNTYIF